LVEYNADEDIVELLTGEPGLLKDVELEDVMKEVKEIRVEIEDEKPKVAAPAGSWKKNETREAQKEGVRRKYRKKALFWKKACCHHALAMVIEENVRIRYDIRLEEHLPQIVKRLIPAWNGARSLKSIFDIWNKKVEEGDDDGEDASWIQDRQERYRVKIRLRYEICDDEQSVYDALRRVQGKACMVCVVNMKEAGRHAVTLKTVYPSPPKMCAFNSWPDWPTVSVPDVPRVRFERAAMVWPDIVAYVMKGSRDQLPLPETTPLWSDTVAESDIFVSLDGQIATPGITDRITEGL